MNDTNDGDTLFRKYASDIKPIRNDRVEHLAPRPLPVSRPLERRDIKAPVSSYPSPCAENEWRRGGLQDKRFRELRRGRIPAQETLDLHGMNREVALDRLERFIDSAQRQGIRCALIIHGKGLQSGGQAVLRYSVPAWLKEMPEVLAYCPALPRHGGNGALYVLFRRPYR